MLGYGFCKYLFISFYIRVVTLGVGMASKEALFVSIFFVLLASGIAFAGETAVLVKSNEAVLFNATQLFPGITLTDVTWDFADDSTGTGITVMHSYAMDGVYRVSATATDDDGKRHSVGLAVIAGGSVPFVSDQAPYVAISFSSMPSGIFRLNVSQTDTTDIDTSSLFVGGKFFEITSDLPSESFSSTLIFSYNDEDDNGMVDGTYIDEKNLDVYFYDGASWVALNSVRDTNANSITVTTSHFTRFALLSTVSSPPGGGAGGSGGGSGGSSSGVGGGSAGGSGGSAGGGGGITGTTTTNQTQNATAQGCQEQWTCSDWSACSNSVQTRTCSDSNSCGTANNKPIENQPCSAEEMPKQMAQGFSITGFFAGIGTEPAPTALVAVIVIVILAIIVYAIMRSRKRGAKKK